MRRFSAGFILISLLGITFPQPGNLFTSPLMAQEQNENSGETKEDAELLYGEAIDFQKKGDLAQALDSYSRAMRMDRSILALDDHGLIEALKKDCIEKLKTTPDDVKLLETLGFVYAVCYSDNKSAIECYEKVLAKVDDEKVKERTIMLIDRLRESAELQENYEAEVSSQLRDERLKAWNELERSEKFSEETSRVQEKSSQLAESYKRKDDLKNRIPQLENELKDLQDEYDKADRLFYTLSDNSLYERRRRRLKNLIADKQAAVEEAKSELSEVEQTSSSLESELSSIQKEKEASPVRSYNDSGNATNGEEGNGSYSSENAGNEGENGNSDENHENVPVQPPSNDYGSPDSSPEPTQEQPLPTVDNPDFPQDQNNDVENGDSSSTSTQTENSTKKLEDLINNL